MVEPLTNESSRQPLPELASRDRHLGSIYKTLGVPPMWGRRPGFETLLRIVLEQQVSLISARAVFARLKSNIEPFNPASFISRDEPYLRSLGLTRQKRITAFKSRTRSRTATCKASAG